MAKHSNTYLSFIQWIISYVDRTADSIQLPHLPLLYLYQLNFSFLQLFYLALVQLLGPAQLTTLEFQRKDRLVINIMKLFIFDPIRLNLCEQGLHCLIVILCIFLFALWVQLFTKFMLHASCSCMCGSILFIFTILKRNYSFCYYLRHLSYRHIDLWNWGRLCML